MSLPVSYLRALLRGSIDHQSNTLKVLLVGPTYAYDPLHEFVDSITPGANECAGASYARQTLTGKVVAQNNVTLRANFKFDNVTFPLLDVGTVSGAWLFKQITNDSDSPLIQFSAFTRSSNGGNLILQVNALGAIIAVEVAA